MRAIPPLVTILSSTFFVVFFSVSAQALQLQVSSSNAHPGDAVTVKITVGDYAQEEIAAAAFTLTFSTDQLTLTGVESDFFDSFTSQWSSLSPPPDPIPPSAVILNGRTYTRPVLFNTRPDTPLGEVLIAGARVKAGTPSTLLTLHFTVNPAAAPGTYPISISPTSVSNTDAGYDGGGTLIPVLYNALVGENDLTAAYPSYLPTLVNGAVYVEMPLIDTDNDGIYDTWETDHFGDLTTADATTDYDQDGYTDLQEYLNAYYPVETDPDGNVYDPTVKNAPGGTGYNPVDNKGFWLMMLPAILGAGHP